MNNQFTFNFRGQGATNNETTTNTSTGYNGYTRSNYVRKPTDKQIAYYFDLCTQRRVQPKNYTTWSYEQMGVEIEELRKYYPASDAQIRIIKDKITNLQSMEVNINMLSDAELNALTGGREGTASALIESLMKMEEQYIDKMPPTDKQLEMLVSMYLCPDVAFEENFGIKRRIELENNMWRRPTPEEFAEEIKSKMKRRDASKFIDDFRGVFHIWKQTRIKIRQKEYIKELELRMVNLGSPSVVEFSIDQNGNIVPVQKQVQDKSSKYNPRGYQPLDDFQLDMMSEQEASQYIDILKSEARRPDLYSGFEKGSDNSDTFEELRTAKDENEAKVKEFVALQDLIFKLEAVAGYNNQEVHDAVNYYLVEEGGSKEAITDSKRIIKEFMHFLLDNDYIGFEGIADMCKTCKTAQDIFMGK